VFANRDFHELPDGEVRLSHPLDSHLAHTAALWRKACEPVAEWLTRSFNRASDQCSIRAVLAPSAAAPSRVRPASASAIPMLAPPLPGFIAAAYGRRISVPSVLRQRAGIREEPVPAACWECGRALAPERRAFCCDECEVEYRRAMGKRRSVVETAAPAAGERQRESAVATQRLDETLPDTDCKVLRRWYTEELQPALSRMHPTEIARSAAMGRSYAYYIVAGTRIPHPRHYPNLAALVGVELPETFRVGGNS
jgi:hypothetical protein